MPKDGPAQAWVSVTMEVDLPVPAEADEEDALEHAKDLFSGFEDDENATLELEFHRSGDGESTDGGGADA